MSYSYQTPECPDLEGHIMMLPKLSEIDPTSIASLPIGTGIFNHPVIILSKQGYGTKVAVFVLTSFNSTSIENHYRDPSGRISYLPIRPAAHPDTTRVLILAHGKFMKKESYVNIKEIYEIPFGVLRPCWRDSHLHLDRASYQILTAELWKNNIGELGYMLRRHGILEQVTRPTHGQVPVSASSWYPSHSYSQQPGYGATSTRILDSPTSEYYGTFTRSTPTIQPQISTSRPIATTPPPARNATRVYNYPVGAHQARQSRPARHSQIKSRQPEIRMDHRHYNENNNDASGPSCFGFLFILCIFIAACYYFLKYCSNDTSYC
ncbi:hypothetical protein FPOA_13928 [Fusarium poae]|uniref:Uncharacterized protein n=1 Tax=Fusarium poae TaxID=36050 RepID=A0A1B8A3X8_FUSPO|nr:hypothetical protein FPOA_13928 [Fusarium poae]